MAEHENNFLNFGIYGETPEDSLLQIQNLYKKSSFESLLSSTQIYKFMEHIKNEKDITLKKERKDLNLKDLNFHIISNENENYDIFMYSLKNEDIYENYSFSYDTSIKYALNYMILVFYEKFK